MATQFSDIYDPFLVRISDYEILKLLPCDRDEIIQTYLVGAVSEFCEVTNIDLSDYDLETQQFNIDLNKYVIEILVLGMLSRWISRYVNNTELFSVVLSTKNWTFSSPATVLGEMKTIRDKYTKEFESKCNIYSYRHGDLETLRT